MSMFQLEMFGDDVFLESEKLIPKLMNAKHYIIHYANLQYFLEKGVILKQIHRGISLK